MSWGRRHPMSSKTPRRRGRPSSKRSRRASPKVIVHVEPKQPPDLTVLMNGAALELIGKAFELDPGSYVFEAKGGGLVAGRVTVEAAERTTTEVRLVLRAQSDSRRANPRRRS